MKGTRTLRIERPVPIRCARPLPALCDQELFWLLYHLVTEAVKQCPLSQVKKLSPEESSRPGRSRPAWRVSLPARRFPPARWGEVPHSRASQLRAPLLPKWLWPDRGRCHLWHLEEESILKLIKMFQCGKYTNSVSHSSLGVSSCPDGKALALSEAECKCQLQGLPDVVRVRARVRAWKGPILCWTRAKTIISAGFLMRIPALPPAAVPDFGREPSTASLHRHLPGPPVPRSHRPFFSLYLVSQQLLAGPVALPVCQEAFFFFKPHFLSVPASFHSRGPASLGPIRLDQVVKLPLWCRQGPGGGKFCAKWPAHRKLLGVSNLSIETSQVHILGITHQLD